MRVNHDCSVDRHLQVVCCCLSKGDVVAWVKKRHTTLLYRCWKFDPERKCSSFKYESRILRLYHFSGCRGRTIWFQRNVRNVDVICIWVVRSDGKWSCVTGCWVFHVTETVIVVSFSRIGMSKWRYLLIVSKVICEKPGDPMSHLGGTSITHPHRWKNLKTNLNFVYKF